MAIAVYPGSFDPMTYGHLDIIRRAAPLTDQLVVGVLINRKKQPLFTTEERVEFLRKATEDLPNVSIMAFDGLAIDFADQCNAAYIIRGVRFISDFDNELSMAQTNSRLNDKVDTIFFPADPEYANVSSSVVKEIAAYGGNVSQFVPPFVGEKLQEKVRNKGESRNE